MHQGPPYPPPPPYPQQGYPRQGHGPYPPFTPPPPQGGSALLWVLGLAGAGLIVFVGLVFVFAFFKGYKAAKDAAELGAAPMASAAAPPPAGGLGAVDEDDDEGDLGGPWAGGPRLPVPPPRDVPHHDVKMLAGCSAADLRVVSDRIDTAIAVGAPLYNRGDFEGCYEIYDGAAADIEKALPSTCKGPTQALEAGRKKARSLSRISDRAWALRDAFDGLVDVIDRKGLDL
jgi:hypothetical protein